MIVIAGAGLAATITASGLGSEGAPAPVVASVAVVAQTPWPGSLFDRQALPSTVFTLTEDDLDRPGFRSVTDALAQEVPSAAINDVEGNPFQPDILFRGFTASPAAGTPQGLAIYVDGARFNEPFGDTVNWDLIAPSAIRSVTIQGANPLFGLNALGGAVDVRLKTGETFRGRRLTTYGGSYGARAAILEMGDRLGDWTYYLAADLTHDGGFRQTGASDLEAALRRCRPRRRAAGDAFEREPGARYPGQSRGDAGSGAGRQHLQHLHRPEHGRQSVCAGDARG